MRLLITLILLPLFLTSSPVHGRQLPDKKELDCLAKMIYHEARGEGRTGMIAVAHVAVNRKDTNPEVYGKTVCEVVRKPYQFSGMVKEHEPIKEQAAWYQSLEIAKNVLTGQLRDITKGALYFHTTQVQPTWSFVKDKVLILGNHIFYK